MQMTEEQKIDDKKKKSEFNIKEFGDKILAGFSIISDNSGLIYIYHPMKGYYEHDNSIKYLEHVINDKLGRGTNSGTINEVVKYIQRSTYKALLLSAWSINQNKA